MGQCWEVSKKPLKWWSDVGALNQRNCSLEKYQDRVARSKQTNIKEEENGHYPLCYPPVYLGIFVIGIHGIKTLSTLTWSISLCLVSVYRNLLDFISVHLDQSQLKCKQPWQPCYRAMPICVMLKKKKSNIMFPSKVHL